MASSKLLAAALSATLLCISQAVAASRAVEAAAPIAPLNCSSFNASAIKLITFDVFAALMDTPDSLVTNVAAVFPSFSQDQLQSFVGDWLDAYGFWFGKTFPSNALPEPFPWVIENSLVTILASRNLSVPRGSPTWDQLVSSWARLAPWQGVADTLHVLQQNGYKVAALSNGDAATLRQATSVFAQHSPPVYMDACPFSSDWPLGAFKPLPQIYYQALAALGGNSSSPHYLHVAGSSIDAYGARSAGLFAGLSNGETPMPGPQPCFVIANLTMLPAVLGIKRV